MDSPSRRSYQATRLARPAGNRRGASNPASSARLFRIPVKTMNTVMSTKPSPWSEYAGPEMQRPSAEYYRYASPSPSQPASPSKKPRQSPAKQRRAQSPKKKHRSKKKGKRPPPDLASGLDWLMNHTVDDDHLPPGFRQQQQQQPLSEAFSDPFLQGFDNVEVLHPFPAEPGNVAEIEALFVDVPSTPRYSDGEGDGVLEAQQSPDVEHMAAPAFIAPMHSSKPNTPHSSASPHSTMLAQRGFSSPSNARRYTPLSSSHPSTPSALSLSATPQTMSTPHAMADLPSYVNAMHINAQFQQQQCPSQRRFLHVVDFDTLPADEVVDQEQSGADSAALHPQAFEAAAGTAAGSVGADAGARAGTAPVAVAVAGTRDIDFSQFGMEEGDEEEADEEENEEAEKKEEEEKHSSLDDNAKHDSDFHHLSSIVGDEKPVLTAEQKRDLEAFQRMEAAEDVHEGLTHMDMDLDELERQAGMLRQEFAEDLDRVRRIREKHIKQEQEREEQEEKDEVQRSEEARSLLEQMEAILHARADRRVEHTRTEKKKRQNKKKAQQRPVTRGSSTEDEDETEQEKEEEEEGQQQQQQYSSAASSAYRPRKSGHMVLTAGRKRTTHSAADSKRARPKPSVGGSPSKKRTLTQPKKKKKIKGPAVNASGNGSQRYLDQKVTRQLQQAQNLLSSFLEDIDVTLSVDKEAGPRTPANRYATE